MSLNIIEKMQRLTAKKRLKLLQEIHDKNIEFFKGRHAELSEFLKVRGTGHFRIDVTEDFVDIVDLNTGAYCHPQTGLLRYVQELGSWHHDRWVDKVELSHMVLGGIEHGDIIKAFVDKLHQELPALDERMGSGITALPRLKDGRRYSGAVAFVGIATGLHIAHYLSHTQVRDIILIEPDLDSFCLSTFFIDYAALDKHNRLVLHVGPDLPEEQLSTLINESHITAPVWLRVLPGYPPSEELTQLIQRLHLRWRSLIEILVPFDREVRNLTYGLRNLKAKLPVNYISPKLSENSRIVVVGSGPSLNNDLAWLKENQEKLIIFATHSSVKVLQQQGISPDFQCSLDTEIGESILDKLELDRKIPFVSYYKASSAILDRFDKVLLINERNKANPVLFNSDLALNHTHPTSGNLAVATAMFARPKQLYLLGMDLGFRSLLQEHAKGYWAGEPETAAPDMTQTSLAIANFVENQGTVYTKSYYDSARMTIEGALKMLLQHDTEIFNLSDGVKIEGAKPLHSGDTVLTEYPEKKSDIDLFENAFTSDSEKLWKPYKVSGSELLNTIRETLLETVTLKKFDWQSLAKALDYSWYIILHRCISREEGDLRVEAYVKILSDLLTEWYRTLIFTKTPAETEIIYQSGLKALREILERLKLPEELDIFLEHTDNKQ
jgi:hypothetical protein